MHFYEAVVKRVNTLMTEFEYTKEILEEKANFPQNYLDIILSNSNKEIATKDLIKIVAAFNITLSEFFNDRIFLWKNLDVL